MIRIGDFSRLSQVPVSTLRGKTTRNSTHCPAGTPAASTRFLSHALWTITASARAMRCAPTAVRNAGVVPGNPATSCAVKTIDHPRRCQRHQKNSSSGGRSAHWTWTMAAGSPRLPQCQAKGGVRLIIGADSISVSPLNHTENRRPVP